MTTPLTRLRIQAEQALAEYAATYEQGGEAVYPQWAADVMALIAEVEQLREAA